jgi:hypothetical protein
MGNLNEIKERHGRDRWKDAVFICAAVLLTALSIGSVTSKAAGKPHQHQWKVTVIESNLEIQR